MVVSMRVSSFIQYLGATLFMVLPFALVLTGAIHWTQAQAWWLLLFMAAALLGKNYE